MAKAAKTVHAAGADKTGAERSKRCGFVALIGAPNAGKSTLLNAFVGEKVAIVTPKVQTTRMRLKGIAMHGPAQIVFVDTPGIFAPRRRLDRAMVAAAWEGARDADEVVLVVDAERGIDARVGMILEGLNQEGRPVVVALNKIDRVKKPALLELARRLDETGLAKRIFMISAIRGEGVADLEAWLADNLPEGPWLYPVDQVTDIANRVMAAEITREKIYLRLHEELPYQIAVETEEWEERDDGSVAIRQVIHVMRETQKRIVIGHGGRMLKEIGCGARLEMEEIFARRVHLFLFVRVSECWQDERRHYLELGLDYVR